MDVILENIPEEMKSQKRWVNWKLEPRPKDKSKMQKTPYMPFALHLRASSTNSAHWSTCKQAAYQHSKGNCSGIGFVLGEGYVLIDLDNCIVEGKVTPKAMEIIKLMDSYTERSPSGNGVHIFVKTNLEDIGNRRTEGLEIYSRDRYSTVTGDCKKPKPIEFRDAELQKLIDEYLPAKPDAPIVKREPKPKASSLQAYGPITEMSESDRQLWQKMFSSKQGEKYKKLFNGTHGIIDASYADKQLLNGLAFWTGYDASRMRAMALQTKLYRDRWNEQRNGMPMLDFQIQESLAFASKAEGLHKLIVT